MAALSVLAIAVASGRAGYVYLDGTQLMDWGITVKAVKSGSELVGFVQELINTLRPDVLVTEVTDERSRKGRRTKGLIQAIARIASHNELLDVCVERPRIFPSKYEEAEHLAGLHVEVAGYLPKQKRRIFDFEPRGMVIFEAIALAHAVINGPPERLAAALG